MKVKIQISFLMFLFICFMGNINLYSQNTSRGTLIGRITGSEDKKPLPFATVMVEGTNNGAAADLNGNYIIRNINAGKQIISVSYVGYKTKNVNLIIKPDKTTELNVALEITSVKGKEVVVTAQRIGQQGAINEQINSNVIKNVVSADRLQENPDANLAESIGRLPGMSLIRSGGEGTGIVIRGLDPKYTQILINGIPLPSTDPNTRATDISGISQYSIQGVDVFKSITPDMEGDAVAGTINLKLGEAPSGSRSSILVQGGYNDLNNYRKNYKLVGSFSNRFFNENLGVTLGIDLESVNRSDQSLSAFYQTKSIPSFGKFAPLYVGGIDLNDIQRINHKSSGTLVFDYKLSSQTKLLFFNFFSYTNQNLTQVSKQYDLNAGGVNYNISYTPDNSSELYTGSLQATHEFRFFKLDEEIAFSQSHVYTPDSRNWLFESTVPALSKYGDITTQSLPLNQILTYATDTSQENLNKILGLYSMSFSANDMIEKQINIHVNCKIPFTLNDYTSAYVKFGGEYKENLRLENPDYRNQTLANWINTGFAGYATQNLPWASATTNGLTLSGLSGGNVNNFLKGQYNFGWYPNITRLNNLFNWWNNFSNYYLNVDPKDMPPAFGGYKIGFNTDWYSTKYNSQKLNEVYDAGYIMGELNFGDILVFIPGIRYEKVNDNINGWWLESGITTANPNIAPGQALDSTHNDEFWLPMVHLKIKPSSWMQALFSYTQTLQRPNYDMLMSNVFVNKSSMPYPTYSSGNPALKPELWTSYDAQVAIFGDKIGLISLSGFYKKVKDMIWTPSTYRTAGQPWTFGVGQYFSNNSTVLITVPQNFNYPAYLKGLEFEMQTNLWFLPEPFNYISLDANFTLINSTTYYKNSYTRLLQTGVDSKGRPTYKLESIDSVYSGPMLNQPKSVANFSFGYNYKGFNLWLSYQYTGAMVTSEPSLKEFESNKSKFVRWDLQITQKLPIKGVGLLFNFANINNPIEYQNNLGDSRPTYLESYGWTMDFGIRCEL